MEDSNNEIIPIGNIGDIFKGARHGLVFTVLASMETIFSLGGLIDYGSTECITRPLDLVPRTKAGIGGAVTGTIAAIAIALYGVAGGCHVLAEHHLREPTYEVGTYDDKGQYAGGIITTSKEVAEEYWQRQREVRDEKH